MDSKYGIDFNILSQFTFGELDLAKMEQELALDKRFTGIGHLLPGTILVPQRSSSGHPPYNSPTYSPGHRYGRMPGFMGPGFGGPGSAGCPLGTSFTPAGYDVHPTMCGGSGVFFGGPCNTMVGGGLSGDYCDFNPYDPRITCNAGCWCPGIGLGLPCCSTADSLVDGDFRRIECRGNLCTEIY